MIAVSAKSLGEINSPTIEFLDNFLSNLKEGDINAAFECIEDERIELNPNINVAALSAEEKANIQYTNSAEYFKDCYEKEAIAEYSSLTDIGNNTITADIVFSDGSEATIPFKVLPDGDSFRVKITDQDLSVNGYVETKAKSDTVDEISSRAGDWKDSYEFSYLYGTIYGIDTFSVSKNGIQIVGYQVVGYQENDAIESGWQSPAEVVYAIVVKHWYGDNVWASTNNAIIKNGSFDIKLVGKNSSQSDLRIRISNQTGANPRSAGSGTIYSVTI